MEAIDRIMAGKPTEKSLRALATKGEPPSLNVTNVSLEAGYARTYLYKNKDAMARVWRRIDTLANPTNPGPTREDVVAALRQQVATLRAERDLAIDAARRCMQETMRARQDSSGSKAKARLEGEVRDLKAQLIQLEAENARLRGDKNIVPFRT